MISIFTVNAIPPRIRTTPALDIGSHRFAYHRILSKPVVRALKLVISGGQTRVHSPMKQIPLQYLPLAALLLSFRG